MEIKQIKQTIKEKEDLKALLDSEKQATFIKSRLKEKIKFPEYCKKCKNSIFPALFSAHCKNKGCGDLK